MDFNDIKNRAELGRAILPPTFFNPNSEFVDWILDYVSGRLVIDIGCGNGNFMRKLKKKGHNKLIGFDPFTDYYAFTSTMRKEFGEMIQLLPYEFAGDFGKSLLSKMPSETLICFLNRPCHSPLLVRDSYLLCKELGIELIYIGLEKNLELDLDDWDIPYKVLEHKGVGQDKEIVLKLV